MLSVSIKKVKCFCTVIWTSLSLPSLVIQHHCNVNGEGIIKRGSTKLNTLVTGNAKKKGSLNLSLKLEWLCLHHRQAWSRPQSPVKWESVETGQGWMLQWSYSVERTYRECERLGIAEGGVQYPATKLKPTKPASSSTVCPLFSESLSAQ